MVSSISAATAAYYNSLSVPKGSDWIASTVTAIKNSQSQAGIMGALARSGHGVSISSFLSSSTAFANNFATIAQTSVTNSGSLSAQIASDNQKSAAAKKMQTAIDALNTAQNMVQPTNTLDPVLYLGNGVTVDTTSNIMTMSNGTQVDITTGVQVIDSSSIIEMGNGSYLNTSTNILTLSDGTKIDTVTGLQVV
ncbi:MAG: hypothetical protein WCA36_21440 [Pseudolabrys sp.]|jgi:hypothetical protein